MAVEWNSLSKHFILLLYISDIDKLQKCFRFYSKYSHGLISLTDFLHIVACPSFDPDPTTRHTVWSILFGATFTWLAIYGKL
jgi:hypothetical protein